MALPLPSALQGFTQSERWVTWKWVTKPNGSKTKEPFRARFPAMHASTSQPTTWAPFSAALKTYQSGLADGVGYVVREDEDHIFLDLDKCRDPATGEVASWAAKLVEEADSYTEITPSGTGLRIIGTKGWIANPIHAPIVDPDGHEIEVYFRAGRYVTVSGVPLPGAPDRLNDISEVTIGILERGGTKRIRPGHEPEERKSNVEPTRSIEAVRAALAVIPNDQRSWHHWTMVGMAAWRTTGGSAEGREAWREWSAKHPLHDDAAVDERWSHWFISPPTKLGFGTLYHLARKARPLFVAPYDPVLTEANEASEPCQSPDPEDVFPTLDIEGLRALPPVEWLIGGILTTDGFSVPYGPPGSLKTFVVLDWSLCICSGLSWNGKPVRQGTVLYVAAEGVRGIARRVRAWQIKRNLDGVDLPFRLLPASVDMTDPAKVAKLVRTAVAAARTEGCPIALVVIDTVARAIPGADENSAQDMGRFVAAVEAIKAGVSCHVLGVHHSGKDEDRGARGSNSLLGAVDTMIRVKRDGDNLRLTIEKQKDEDEGEPIELKIEKVEWLDGLRQEGSLVLVPNTDKGPRMAEVDLVKVATVIGPNGRMSTRKLGEAIGATPGRQTYEMANSIPFFPDYAKVSLPSGTVKVFRARTGKASNSPIDVVRSDQEEA